MTAQTLAPAATIDPQAAAAALKQAIALLDQAGEHLPQIRQFTRSAAGDADCALMIANNEAKLAARGD